VPPITYIHLTEVDSTNTYLMTLPRDPAQPYVAVHADYQTAGRGQRGNTWQSAAGQNLLGSIRHHPTFLRPEQQFVLSQLIALAIVEELSSLLPSAADDLRIKWPNDIYWRDRKLCGILIEYQLSTTAIEQAIIGFGVNVNQTDFGPAPGDTTLRLPSQGVLGSTFRPTSLRLIAAETAITHQPSDILHHTSDIPFDIPALFHAITERYVQSVAALAPHTSDISPQTSDISPQTSYIAPHTSDISPQTSYITLQSSYVRRLYRLGIPARYRDADGDFTATIDGVNPDGTLRLRLPDGTLRHYEFKQVAYII